MRDALGRVESVLLLGGTSEIGVATTRELVARGASRVVLAARDLDAAGRAADDLRRAGATDVRIVEFDAGDTASHEKVIDGIFDAHGDIDLTILAFGVLGDQPAFDASPRAAAEAVQVNYVGAVSSGLAVAGRIRSQGHGTLVVLSSVAGQRARQSNYVYGSSKAGLDAFAQGLGDALVGSGGRVVIVRPGFVRTRMTAGMDEQPFSVGADAVAAAVVRALERGDEVVWVPPVLRWVFAVMRLLPRRVWRIVSAR
jgi:decaprenylphospho-beta-D-erythro-pentofuranosid-2-ulose 2-reductase